MEAKTNWFSVLVYFIVGIIAIAVALAVIKFVIGVTIMIVSIAIGVAIVALVGYVFYIILKALMKHTN